MAHQRTYIRIVAWSTFQHYKDRNPPWIKLHRELLTSNTWVSSSDASRVLAVALMMLAAQTGNQIPNDVNYLMRVAYLASKPCIKPLVDVGFIEIIDEYGNIASNLQADARPEKRQRQRESKRRSIQSSFTTEILPEAPSTSLAIGDFDFFELFWKAYPRKVGKGAARKAWAIAAKKAAPSTIAEGLKGLVAQKLEPKYTPHPATWLNQERWLDEAPKRSGADEFFSNVTGANGHGPDAEPDRVADKIFVLAPPDVLRKAKPD